MRVLDILEEYGEKYKRQYGVRVVYPAMNGFLLAGRPIPPDEYYDDYVQLENGVGMWRLLHDEFMNALPDQSIRAAAARPSMWPRVRWHIRSSACWRIRSRACTAT